MAKDYYKILEVEKGADKEEIKKAYKRLAKKYHPDISKETNAESKFKEINEAAGILLDDQKRKNYDTYGSADGPYGFSGGRGGQAGGGFNPEDFGINLDDIFEQFGFGRGFSDMGGFSQRSRKRGEERVLYQEISISLDEVYFGVEKDIKIERLQKCDVCDGRGAKDKADIERCKTCNGEGVVIEMQRSILGMIRTQRVCPDCHGSGEKIRNPCSACHGKGSLKKKETLSIKIPKGIESGVTLKIEGKGNYSKDTGFGDLFLKVFVEKNKDYEVEGEDLHRNISINFIQAILGDEIEFEHFGKTLNLKIQEGIQPNTLLRLRGKGLPIFGREVYGDLYIKIEVEIPSKTSKQQKELLMEYAKTMKDKSFFSRLKGIFG